MRISYKRLKAACYTTNITMSVIANLPPLLFITFRSLYGISYSLLGLLVLINYVTQLGIDLIFSFFSHKFNIHKAVKLTPVIAVAGLLVYAAWPLIFQSNIYTGLICGTIIFSASSGFAEVLISPVIAAIPAEDPDREISKLHSVYAWGVVAVVIFSTVFLYLLGSKYWYLLAIIFSLIPLSSALLFRGTALPEMTSEERKTSALTLLKNKGVWLCVVAIFLGGAAECTMAQWASGYLEQALGIPKIWGDVFGVALFAVMLGTARTLYGKRGKNLERVLLLSAICTTGCYILAATTGNSIVGLAACALTGFCTGMLWPGNLSVAAQRYPGGGVIIFAMMAAGGDLGASIGPQLIGIVTDAAIENTWILSIAQTYSMTPDQLGMKLGLIISSLLPLLGILIQYRLLKSKDKTHIL